MDKLFCFLVLIVAVAAESPKMSKCDEVPESACNVTRVEVNPCKQIEYCKFKKGHNATINVDFTPNFSSEVVKTGFFWASEKGDVAFDELNDADACQYASCPFEQGKPNNFDFRIYILKKLPSGTFPMKWKVWNANNPSEACCFKMTVQLRK